MGEWVGGVGVFMGESMLSKIDLFESSCVILSTVLNIFRPYSESCSHRKASQLLDELISMYL